MGGSCRKCSRRCRCNTVADGAEVERQKCGIDMAQCAALHRFCCVGEHDRFVALASAFRASSHLQPLPAALFELVYSTVTAESRSVCRTPGCGCASRKVLQLMSCVCHHSTAILNPKNEIVEIELQLVRCTAAEGCTALHSQALSHVDAILLLLSLCSVSHCIAPAHSPSPTLSAAPAHAPSVGQMSVLLPCA